MRATGSGFAPNSWDVAWTSLARSLTVLKTSNIASCRYKSSIVLDGVIETGSSAWGGAEPDDLTIKLVWSSTSRNFASSGVTEVEDSTVVGPSVARGASDAWISNSFEAYLDDSIIKRLWLSTFKFSANPWGNEPDDLTTIEKGVVGATVNAGFSISGGAGPDDFIVTLVWSVISKFPVSSGWDEPDDSTAIRPRVFGDISDAGVSNMGGTAPDDSTRKLVRSFTANISVISGGDDPDESTIMECAASSTSGGQSAQANTISKRCTQHRPDWHIESIAGEQLKRTENKNDISIKVTKRKCCHFEEILITSCTRSRHLTTPCVASNKNFALKRKRPGARAEYVQSLGLRPRDWHQWNFASAMVHCDDKTLQNRFYISLISRKCIS